MVNTSFEKPPEQLITYREKVPQHNADREEYEGKYMAPYDCKKYAQCDYALTRKEHFQTILDCEVRISKAKHTDHYPIYGTLKTNLKLGKKHQDRHGEPKKYWKPDEEKKS